VSNCRMSNWSDTDRRIGIVSAASVVAIALVYVTVGAIGVLMRPPGLEPLRQIDPFLKIMEVLIILSAVALIAMVAAIASYAAPESRTWARSSLAFMTMFAMVTIAVHFASLTVGRMAPAGSALANQFSFVSWPSLGLTLDLLAWDVFLGISLLFAVPVLAGKRRVQVGLFLTGGLCLGGAAGPLSGHLWLQAIAIVGYAVMLPVVSFLLMAVFWNQTQGEKLK
jgi:hypothetical protein